MPYQGRSIMQGSTIESIFYSEFHPTLGPKITYQVPKECITKEKFDSLSVYIIPKTELQGKLITVNAHGYKIIGFPVGLDNTKYDRNRLIFNLCFVCEASKRTVQFEPLVRKLSNYLKTLEIESAFLSNEISKSRLPDILTKICLDLNAEGQCSISVDPSNTIYLKVISVHTNPPDIMDHDVPIFVNSHENIYPSQWDLTTQQWDLTAAEILPFIDGFRHVARIAAEADVETSLVKACIQNLVYYGIVTVIPIFQYSNIYTPTPKISTLAQDSKLQEECVKFVVKQAGHPAPPFRSIFQLYCGLSPGTTVKDLCIRYSPHRLGIDERKLIQFGLMKGLIRRLHKYPILSSTSAKPTALSQYYTGYNSYDQICTKTGLSYQELDERVEQDPNVIVCWK